MQPNAQHPYSIDYLDQISTASPKKGANDKLFFIAIIGAVLVAVLIMVFILIGSAPNNTDKLVRLSTRLQTLQTISDSSKKTITSSSLRGININLSLLLTNANRDITEQLTANAVDTDKMDPKIVASESGDDLKQRLETARISGYFDRTYAREMSDQLATLLVLLQDIDAHTKDKSLKDFLATTYDQVQPIQKQFTEFNAATT